MEESQGFAHELRRDDINRCHFIFWISKLELFSWFNRKVLKMQVQYSSGLFFVELSLWFFNEWSVTVRDRVYDLRFHCVICMRWPTGKIWVRRVQRFYAVLTYWDTIRKVSFLVYIKDDIFINFLDKWKPKSISIHCVIDKEVRKMITVLRTLHF